MRLYIYVAGDGTMIDSEMQGETAGINCSHAYVWALSVSTFNF